MSRRAKPKSSKSAGARHRTSPAKRPVVAGPAMAPPRLDLSTIRHDLRTPINHILGYCEMLQEDAQLPQEFAPDLAKIHAGGRQLLALIAEYFDEETFETKRGDVHQLCHDLRTPVNQIIGYSEMLQEQAEETGRKKYLADLRKIRDAAASWLGLMEEHLLPTGTGTDAASALPSDFSSSRILPPGMTFQSSAARAAAQTLAVHGRLLVVDDDESNRDMLGRRLQRDGYTIQLAASGVDALRLLRSTAFDLVLLDLIMSGLDGYQVLLKMKSDPALREIPVIMLSALDQESGIARCIELGAEDYVAKPFSPVFLRARIGACLEKKWLRDKERRTYEALRQSQKRLASELAEAAAYVRSLLPPPLTASVETEWCFQPGEQLGGDAFGYHWVDPDHLAIYLLDVCGHGVGAALLSVSVLNTLRAQTLPGVDFRQPALVLAALNRTFQMEKQNQLYFTIWFGVYRRQQRELVYASGGHPPALLLGAGGSTASPLTALRTPSPAIGCLEEACFTEALQPVEPGARLLVLSDGVFEILRDNGHTGTWAEFVASFVSSEVVALRPAERLRQAQQWHGGDTLEDDFSWWKRVSIERAGTLKPVCSCGEYSSWLPGGSPLRP